ncbi:TonB-dependent receptor [Psychrosphaera sp. 1_MG-2023]|uniref:TonB-dependent receptor n=1 Tax=Psychrosphaera sp. 1_MG-2023 TaxID=3062643 RepID=UPI0026E13EED|nr:TonB-dependent receptor [Psychrosphaera sp. 1_MG-2023]MDO6720638.1 TonB-dependent receptor [Psychrosphaera sp. 1_MG-2023]
MKNATFKKSVITSAVSAALVMSFSSLAVEQQADTQVEKGDIERIKVTATHRKVSQEELPFNISSVLGSDIEDQNISDSAELLRNVAGITIVDKGHRNGGTTNSMIIRGINVESGISGADVGQSTVPTVSSYVDATPIFANFLLKDIERVEVLRGPQGTLYGSGALGGTVRYVMNKPDPEITEGSLKLDLSKTDGSDGNNMTLDAMFNMPINDKSAVRFVVGKLNNDGIIDMPNLYQLDDEGVPLVKADNGSCVSASSSALTASELVNNGSCYHSQKDVDSVDITYFKAAYGIAITDDVQLTLTHHFQTDEVGGRRAVTRGADYNGNVYDDYEHGATLLEPSERDVNLTSMEIEADFGFATLTSNTSSYDHQGSGWRDNTSLWVSGGRDWYNAWYTGNPRPASHVEAGFEDKALVQEFRLVSNEDPNSKIDWIAGVYYMDQERVTTNLSHLRGIEYYGAADVNASGAPRWWVGAPTDKDLTYIRHETFEDLAIYGELTYKFSDDFRATVGARWFDNTLKNNTAIDAYYGQAREIESVPFPTQEESDVLVKLNLSYDINDNNMVYATYSEGFRRGGSNAIPTDGPFAELNPESVETYGKDTVKNYEVGVKGFARGFTYSADVYMVKWDDPQLNTGTAWWAFFMAQNGIAAETSGLELESSVALTEDITMRVGYAFTKAELTDDLIQPQSLSVTAEAGQQLPGVAEHVLSFNISHTTEITNDIEMTSRLSGYYQSESTNSVVPTSSIYTEFDGFSIWNASVNFIKDDWGLSLYIKNLGNEEGVTGSYPDSYLSTDTGVFENFYGNNQKDFIARPQTIGASVSYQF